MNEINFVLILLAALAAISSPGPATLAIAGTSMSQGRAQGLALALGVLTGSVIWSTSAAFGLAAILTTNVWLFEFMRYVGAAYLFYMAYKSMRSAIAARDIQLPQTSLKNSRENYIKGLLIHLTNPKAILFFAALYSVGVPSQARALELLSVILFVGVVSASIFIGYAILFSSSAAANYYLKLKPLFESVFALFFGAASIKLLTEEIVQ